MLFQPASEISFPPINWLWPGYLANGSLALLDGGPGLGKSLITLDLTARLTTGRPWPDGAQNAGPASVLLLCEEDTEGVVISRLQTAAADLPRAFLWPRLTAGSLPRLPSEVQRLDEALTATAAKLVVIDPIMAFLDRKVDVNTDANVRRALRPLSALAEKHRCVILLVRHLNKSEGPKALYRGGASIAFVAACRLAWLAGRSPKLEGAFVLAQQKNNYAPPQPSLAYVLPTDAPRVDWQGPSTYLADDLTARSHLSPRLQRCKRFLLAFLAEAPRTTRDIWNAARLQSLSPRTLRRAKRDLDIRRHRIQEGSIRTDYWALPGQKRPCSDPETDEFFESLRKLEEQFPPPTPLDDEDAV
jgi:hypothetical protein